MPRATASRGDIERFALTPVAKPGGAPDAESMTHIRSILEGLRAKIEVGDVA